MSLHSERIVSSRVLGRLALLAAATLSAACANSPSVQSTDAAVTSSASGSAWDEALEGEPAKQLDDGRSAFDPDESPPKEPNLVLRWWQRNGKPPVWTAVFWSDGTVRVTTSRYLTTRGFLIGPTRERFVLRASAQEDLLASIGRLGELCDASRSVLAQRDALDHGPSLVVWVAQPADSRVVSALIPGGASPDDPMEFVRVTAGICTVLETYSLAIREWAKR